MLRARIILAFLRATALLPLPVVHGLGAVTGWFLWLIPNEQRRVAAVNIALCFPAWNESKRRRLLRHALVENSKAMLELGPLWLWENTRLLGLVRAVEGEEVVRALVAQGRGAIGITPHLGAWELAGLYFSSRYPLTILYRPSRVGLDHIAHKARERLGATVVPTNTAGVRALLRALHSGQVLGILPDQNPGREGGIFAPFFHHQANTMTLVSRLAIKSNAPVFLTYAERLPWGRGYRLVFRPLSGTLNEAPLEASAAGLNQAVEEAVRRLPSQYLWAYKRFKTRPPGEPKLY
jgi:KDO2-lipid IV(A) lauroyltransferase